MPPDSDGVRMVECSLKRLVPNPDHFNKIQDDKPPIRSMTDEDIAFHQTSLCFGCAD